MRRKFSVFTACLLVISLLSGCGSNAGSTSPSSASDSTIVSASTETSASTSTSTEASVSSDPEPDKLPETEEYRLIDDFLHGNGRATISDVEGFPNGEYTFEELIIRYGYMNEAFSMAGFIPDSASYYISDFGNDGMPELILYTVYDELSNVEIPLESYIILKPENGTLNVTCSLDSYYRSYVYVNKYGFVYDGGSSSAFMYANNFGYIDKNGKLQMLMYTDIYDGLNETTLPPESLTVELMEKLCSDTFSYFEEGAHIELRAFAPKNPDYLIDEDYNDYFAKKVKSRKYAFSNDEGHIDVPKDYIDLCKENGIEIVSLEEYDKEVDDAFNNVGITKDMRNTEADGPACFTSLELSNTFNLGKEAVSVYKQFMQEEVKATIEGSDIVEDGSYSYASLATAISDYLKEGMSTSDWNDAQYAFCDAGMDGVPELAVKLIYANPYNPYSKLECLALIKYYSGELLITDIFIDYTEDTISLDRQGGVVSGGTEGGDIYFFGYYAYNSEGERNKIYTCSIVNNLKETKIPDYCLSTILNDKLNPTATEWGGDYYMRIYDIEDDVPYDDSVSFEEHYTDFCKSRYYLFYKEGSNIGADSEYEELCRQNGINIVSGDMIEDLLDKRFQKFNIERSMTGYNVYWMPLSMG